MPEGWEDANESDDYETIADSANASDDMCVKVTAYELTVDDPAVQTVLSTLAIDQSQL